MPNRDGTGPNSRGPMTGRGMGPCGQGRGRGMGRGWRRGGCCGYGMGMMGIPYQPSKEEYVKMLKEEIEDLQAEVEELEK